MEREEMARSRRRDQVQEQLEFERERESLLLDQLADVITEELGPQVDEAAFAQMAPQDVAVVREALGAPAGDGEEDAGDEESLDWPADDEDDGEVGVEAEIARLEGELASCRRRQQALERYREALDRGGGTPPQST